MKTLLFLLLLSLGMFHARAEGITSLKFHGVYVELPSLWEPNLRNQTDRLALQFEKEESVVHFKLLRKKKKATEKRLIRQFRQAFKNELPVLSEEDWYNIKYRPRNISIGCVRTRSIDYETVLDKDELLHLTLFTFQVDKASYYGYAYEVHPYGNAQYAYEISQIIDSICVLDEEDQVKNNSK